MEPHTDSTDKPPVVDKTFIEGSSPASGEKNEDTSLASGKRVDVTSLGNANPYSQQAKQEITDINMLPSGREPIPLGSGIIVGLLGTGGMAKVYKIWNEKLEVSRAVKVLIPTQLKDLRNRFETEVKITAKLHHPNIVEIYSVGEWNGLPFLEMELIEGDSIEAIISRYGKLPFPVCSAIAIFVARALVYAHGQEFLLYGKNYHGVIHRDLKPANVMISKNGDVKLMDFGIARPTEASLHTVEGNIVGTMQYLSPEQIDGIAIDGRTDVYSFGAILYEMLTGTKTFPQETITNLMKKKIVNEYRKFSEFDFQISPALAKVTQKCLQASKETRYASASELLKELESTHLTLTNDDPTRVLRTFFNDPTAFFAKSAQKKTIRLPSAGPALKKLIVPIAIAATVTVVAGIGIIIAVSRSSSPARHDTAKTVEAPAVPAATTTSSPQPSSPIAATVPTAPAPAAHTFPVSERADLRPLSSSTPALPAVQTQSLSTVKQPSQVKQQQKTPAAEYIPVNKVLDKPALSIEQLKTKYGTNDPVIIVRNSLKSGKNAEAIMVLESTPAGSIDPKTKTLLLFESYIASGRTKDAFIIANSQTIQDAQYDYLCGRLYQTLGKNESAISYFESALTKPSAVRKRNDIRDDALYYTALIRSDSYRKNPSAENREQAQNAWNIVKRMYGSTPVHPRFKTANEQLSTVK
jgi:eukaryotic-like serine/threonine-protein kinase